MRSVRVVTFAALGILTLAARAAWPQPLFADAISLEATLINADHVLIGRIVAFDRAQDADNFGAYSITFEGDEILKGPPDALEPRRRLGVRVIHRATTLDAWRSAAVRLLLATGDGSARETTLIDLTAGGPEVLTADFRLLRDPDEVIRAAREALRRSPVAVRRLHTYKLRVPYQAVVGTGWEHVYGTGGHLQLSIPADDLLERRAHEYLRSQDYDRRAEGAGALRYFRSDGNIATLRALLDDPGYIRLSGDAQPGPEVEVRSYGIRGRAFEILRSWGVDVARPVVREEIRKP